MAMMKPGPFSTGSQAEYSVEAKSKNKATMNQRLAEHFRKNRLQEYAQRSGLGLPVYQSCNEGFGHAPRFKATVRVG
ncbi:hypothetical protein PVK06_035352 [Gossypium arboreum]|uniref:DRBM domain-containing protein n=1 Tax=Gossypium arboreum TaxID=29729 RepID=A0ABR0NGK8_GOSAR|nr:hypothetical protein PVK06_035352 [Gossypium arboreum]